MIATCAYSRLDTFRATYSTGGPVCVISGGTALVITRFRACIALVLGVACCSSACPSVLVERTSACLWDHMLIRCLIHSVVVVHSCRCLVSAWCHYSHSGSPVDFELRGSCVLLVSATASTTSFIIIAPREWKDTCAVRDLSFEIRIDHFAHLELF